MPTYSKDIAAIASAMPVLDEEAAQRADDARKAQLATALSGLPTNATAPSAPTARATAQQAATAVQEQTAAQNLTAGQQAAGRMVGAAQAALNAAGQEASTEQGRAELAASVRNTEANRRLEEALGAADRAQKVHQTKEEVAQAQRLQQFGIETDARVSFLTNKQREDLAKLGGDVKSQLFDSRMEFERDEMGRKMSNERQLSDYAVATARSQEELSNRLQTIQQAADRELIAMKAAQSKLEQTISHDFADSERELDQASKERIIRANAELKRQIQAKESRANNIGNLINGVASGAVAGTAVAPGIGTAVGAGVGLAVGLGANQASTGSFI